MSATPICIRIPLYTATAFAHVSTPSESRRPLSTHTNARTFTAPVHPRHQALSRSWIRRPPAQSRHVSWCWEGLARGFATAISMAFRSRVQVPALWINRVRDHARLAMWLNAYWWVGATLVSVEGCGAGGPRGVCATTPQTERVRSRWAKPSMGGGGTPPCNTET